MDLKAIALALIVLALPVTGMAAEPRVVETDFRVWLMQKDGTEQSRSDTAVPLLPGRACFSWQIRLENAPDTLDVREVLQLPAPAGHWGTMGSSISADSTAAKTDRTIVPTSDGWIGARWCLAPGDPLGPHTISVTAGGWLSETFQFEVVEP